MLDSKHRHGIASRSVFGAPNAPSPRCGDDRAAACQGAAAPEFFVWEGIFRRLRTKCYVGDQFDQSASPAELPATFRERIRTLGVAN
jgi:hypothetical protein